MFPSNENLFLSLLFHNALLRIRPAPKLHLIQLQVHCSLWTETRNNLCKTNAHALIITFSLLIITFQYHSVLKTYIHYNSNSIFKLLIHHPLFHFQSSSFTLNSFHRTKNSLIFRQYCRHSLPLPKTSNTLTALFTQRTLKTKTSDLRVMG